MELLQLIQAITIHVVVMASLTGLSCRRCRRRTTTSEASSRRSVCSFRCDGKCARQHRRPLAQAIQTPYGRILSYGKFGMRDRR